MRILARGTAASVVVLAACALPAATQAAVTVTCAPVMTPVGQSGPVSVTGTTCKSGRYVARTYATKGKVPYWSCTAKQYPGGATFTCRKRSSAAVRVRFQLAD